jgi:NMD protein affecting ribosome stability and mRNA decay
MPVESVVRMTCDRCGRVWFPEAAPDGKSPKTPSLTLEMKGPDGEVVYEAVYEVLCDSCVKTTSNYAESITKDLKKPRAKKKGKVNDAPKAPPSPPAPPRSR